MSHRRERREQIKLRTQQASCPESWASAAQPVAQEAADEPAVEEAANEPAVEEAEDMRDEDA